MIFAALQMIQEEPHDYEYEKIISLQISLAFKVKEGLSNRVNTSSFLLISPQTYSVCNSTVVCHSTSLGIH